MSSKHRNPVKFAFNLQPVSGDDLSFCCPRSTNNFYFSTKAGFLTNGLVLVFGRVQADCGMDRKLKSWLRQSSA